VNTIRARLVIVSDLHMSTAGGSVPDPFAEDDAFAAMLNGVGDGAPTRLLLLGDTFDFVLAGAVSRQPSRRDPVAATVRDLGAIAESHPRAFSALGAFTRAGHSVDVVPGNHDIELLHRPVQQRLRQLVARAAGDHEAGARLSFPPWIVHIPHVLYAEHGQQHHDVNHFRGVLNRTEVHGRDRVRRPMGLCLDEARLELAALRDRRPGAAVLALRATALAGRVARGGADLALGGRMPARPAYEQRLRDHAVALGLPRDLLVDVDRRAAPTPARIARRLSRGADFMPAAARGVSSLLSGAGATTAFCVFGHTHLADDRPLWDHVGAPRYLNAGTWSTMVRPGRDGFQDRLRYIEIEHGGGRPPTAALRRWNEQPVLPSPQAVGGDAR
jgi:UDP-2,3-diacylglucosamine pyrophosphatase LpxH